MSRKLSGRLNAMKRSEIARIAEALEVSVLPHAPIFDVKEAILKTLNDNPSLRHDRRFKGLLADASSLGYEEDSDSASSEGESEVEAAPRRRNTPRRSTTSNTTANTANALSNSAKKVVETTTDLIHSAEEIIDSPQARRLLRSSQSQVALIQKKSTVSLRNVAQGTRGFVAGAQEVLSEEGTGGWMKVGLLVAAELGWVAWSAVPWKKLTLGPHHWLLRSPTPSFSLPYPDLSILYHPTFLSSLFSWTLFTVLIPLIVALFLATPSDDDSERSSRTSRRKKVAPPQALQFALARIGCAVLWGYILRRESRVKWDFYAVDGFPAIQVLGSVMSAAFAAVEN